MEPADLPFTPLIYAEYHVKNGGNQLEGALF